MAVAGSENYFINTGILVLEFKIGQGIQEGIGWCDGPAKCSQVGNIRSSEIRRVSFTDGGIGCRKIRLQVQEIDGELRRIATTGSGIMCDELTGITAVTRINMIYIFDSRGSAISEFPKPGAISD